MSNEAADKEIRQRVETALKQLSVLDSDLLHSDVNERTITHRLAVHLERHFDGWDVDCEYNRTGGDPESGSRSWSDGWRRLGVKSRLHATRWVGRFILTSSFTDERPTRDSC